MLGELQKALKTDLKVHVTVWDPNDESAEYTFTSHVMAVQGTLFQIASPPTETAGKILPLLGKGYVVGVILECQPLPYIFYPIIGEEPAKATGDFWLFIPSNTQIELLQQRRHVRIPMMIPFEVEFKDTITKMNRTIGARTENLSGGGVRFTSSSIFNTGQHLYMRMQFDSEQPFMNLQAQVIFSKENRIRKHDDDFYTTACKFVELDEVHETMLVRECFSRELHLKKKH